MTIRDLIINYVAYGMIRTLLIRLKKIFEPNERALDSNSFSQNRERQEEKKCTHMEMRIQKGQISL